VPAIPGYAVLGELGRGGMGVVYKARHLGLDRVVALKMIRTGVHADAEQRGRFQAEAEAAARLQHPNIVQVFEVGEAGRDQPYFSLEYVEGGSLLAQLGQAPQDPRRAAALAATLAGAIDCAHQHGVVHRDLKPANVLLARDGTPKITDFGLAKRLEDPGLTQSGAVLGTPSYMAPEQADGRTREVGPLSDVYALGAILYEMLTGRPPFRAASVLDTLDQVRYQEPVAPRRLQPGVPRDLETVCLKCLEKDPRKRYAGAGDLADDLRRFQGGLPIRARPVGWAEKAAKWARRRPGVTALIALAVLSAVLGFVVILAEWRQAEAGRVAADEAADRFVKQRELAGQAADKARQARLLLTGETALAQDALDSAETRRYFNNVALAGQALDVNQLAQADEWLDQCPPALCAWEWRYLRRQAHADLLRTPAVGNAAFSPDGKSFVTGTRENLCQVWDVASGRVARLFRGHQAGITWVAYRPDGRQVASADQGGTVRLWDPATAREVRTLQGTAAPILCLAYSPDGKTLAAAGHDRFVHLWDLETGIERFRCQGHEAAVQALAFDPAGRVVASGGSDRTVRLWDPATGGALHTLANQAIVFGLAFRPDGKELLTTTTAGVGAWDPAAGKFLRHYRTHPTGTTSVAYSPDGKRLAAGGKDGTVRTFTLEGGAGHLHRCYAGAVFSLAYSPDGKRLVTTSREDLLRVWDDTVQPGNRVLEELPGQATAVVVSPDLRHFAVGCTDGTVRVWDARTRREAYRLAAHDDVVSAVSWGPDSRRLATCGWDKVAKVWDLTTRRPVATFRGHDDAVESVCFSPDGKQAASSVGGTDPSTKVWEADTGREVRSVAGHRPVFSPDGRHLATIRLGLSGDLVELRYSVGLWDARTGKEVRTLPGSHRSLFALAFSPDGKRLAAAGGEFLHSRELRVWEVDTGRQSASAVLPGRAAMSLAFSPDGKRLATGNVDATVSVWDPSGREVLVLRGHGYGVLGVAFTPDGRDLLSASGDRTLRLWEAGPVAEPRTLHGQGAFVQDGRFSPDGALLATAGRDGTIRLWDTATWEVQRVLRAQAPALREVAFSPDGSRLVGAGGDPAVQVWDLRRDRGWTPGAAGRGPDQTFRGHRGNVYCVAQSPDGKRLASGDDQGDVKLWDAATGEALSTLATGYKPVLHLSYSPDGRSLAVCGLSDPVVRLYDAESGRLLQTLAGHSGAFVHRVIFGPPDAGGKAALAATCGSDGTVRVWDLAGGKTITTCRIDYVVWAVAFSPDGRLLASGDMLGCVKLWDPRTGRELRACNGHHREVTSVSFSPDGRLLASCSRDESVKVWPVAAPAEELGGRQGESAAAPDKE
jgi:WD40 repeat protein